jgi:hypothetical protein
MLSAELMTLEDGRQSRRPISLVMAFGVSPC